MAATIVAVKRQNSGRVDPGGGRSASPVFVSFRSRREATVKQPRIGLIGEPRARAAAGQPCVYGRKRLRKTRNCVPPAREEVPDGTRAGGLRTPGDHQKPIRDWAKDKPEETLFSSGARAIPTPEALGMPCRSPLLRNQRAQRGVLNFSFSILSFQVAMISGNPKNRRALAPQSVQSSAGSISSSRATAWAVKAV